MTTGQVRFSIFGQQLLLAMLAMGCSSQGAQSANTITIPGKPTSDTTALSIVSTADTKMSHKRITVGDYVFVPTVGKCWNVGSYKLRRGNQVLSQGYSDKYWPNSTYFSVITPLIVPAGVMPPAKLGTYPGDFAKTMQAPIKALAPGYNVFNSGSPEIIIERANCGAKCLYEYSIFSLGKNFKSLAKLESGNDPINFIDIGGDGKVEGIGLDNTYDCWNFSSASSPRISVVLRFKNGKPQLATDLMKTPPPTASYMNKVIAETKQELQPPKEGDGHEADGKRSDDIILPTVMVSTMLDLIYSGNGKSAWQYLDQVWPQRNLTWESTMPKETVNKEQFVAQFKKQLAKSPYWNDLKAMNSW